jgi:hypothetical protein
MTQIERPGQDKPKRKRLVEEPVDVPFGLLAFMVGGSVGGFLQWAGFGLIGSLVRIAGFASLAWYVYIKVQKD